MFFNKNTVASTATNTTGGDGTSAPTTAGDSAPVQSVPIWKFAKVNDKVKEMEAALKKYQDQEKQKQEEEAKAKGEYQKLLDAEKQAREKLALENQQLLTMIQQKELSSIVMKEVAKLSPNDADDVLRFIDLSKFSVDETGNVPTLKETLEKLKTDKPYLFGQPANQVNPIENGRPAAGADALSAIESEYRALLTKSQSISQQLSPDEAKRLRMLSVQLTNLKKEQKK